jgi:hypothetical protein
MKRSGLILRPVRTAEGWRIQWEHHHEPEAIALVKEIIRRRRGQVCVSRDQALVAIRQWMQDAHADFP